MSDLDLELDIIVKQNGLKTGYGIRVITDLDAKEESLELMAHAMKDRIRYILDNWNDLKWEKIK